MKIFAVSAAILMCASPVVAGGGHKHGGGRRGGGGGYGGGAAAFTSFNTLPSTRVVGAYDIGYASRGFNTYSTGGYGTGVGGYGTGNYAALALQSSSGGAQASGYGVGSYGVGGYGTGNYAALAIQSSSGGGALGYGVGLQQAPLPQGPPPLPQKLGHGHKGVSTAAFVQPVVQAPAYENVEVQEFVSTQGPVVENQVNSYSNKKKYAITHRPVYHKTVYNHYTAHDTINKDVIHHVGEKETRAYDVAGKNVYAGSVSVNHGEKPAGMAQAYYVNAVGAGATGGTGSVGGGLGGAGVYGGLGGAGVYGGPGGAGVLGGSTSIGGIGGIGGISGVGGIGGISGVGGISASPASGL